MNSKNISYAGLIDLAQPRLGTRLVFRTDEFFAPAKRMISPSLPIYKEGVFDKHGKWMDGWETRRKRTKGHDYVILRLGKIGSISKVDIDTSFFVGNHPQVASIEACNSKSLIPNNNVRWHKLIGKKKLKSNRRNIFATKNKSVFTHVKLNIFPDGGVARLRLFGSISAKHLSFGRKEIDLASLCNGAAIIACNNEHFGKAENILAPGKANNMGDGWETRRRRSKGFDWAIFKLGIAGSVSKIKIDTHHFRGNYPDRCSLQATFIKEKMGKNLTKKIIKNSSKWNFLLNKTKLSANKSHSFKNKLMAGNCVNYVKINIFPDGGISRVRLFGKVSKK